LHLCIRMFLFSTIIYFGDNPAGYDVYKENDCFQFRPAIGGKVDPEPLQLAAVYCDGILITEGTKETEIIEQMKKIVDLSELISPLNVAA